MLKEGFIVIVFSVVTSDNYRLRGALGIIFITVSP